MDEIIKKLKFKDPAVVINCAPAFKSLFLKAGFKSSFGKKPNANTLVFINNKKDLLQFLDLELKNVEPDSVLWFAYPKGTSKMKTDINRDTIRKTGERYGITTVTAISLDDTWSALRFRPIDRVGK